MNLDPTDTDPTDTDPTDTGTGVLVTTAEIAEFLQHLRALTRPGAVADPTRDGGGSTAERAAFLAREADLFARIAAQQPELVPTATITSSTGAA